MECSVLTCDRESTARGLCKGHYARLRRLGDVQADRPLQAQARRPVECSINGCVGVAYARGWCRRHHARWRRLGDPEAGKDGRHGYQRRKNGEGHIMKDGYLQIQVKGRGKMLQHRWVMEQHLGRELLPEEEVHHKNGVRLDNRLLNLELWSGAHPKSQRVEDLLAWANEIVVLYG